MATDEEIARVVGELHEARNGRDVRNLVFLCNSIIQETREDNDTAGRIRTLRNQGKINGFRELLDSIENGNPTILAMPGQTSKRP